MAAERPVSTRQRDGRAARQDRTGIDVPPRSVELVRAYDQAGRRRHLSAASRTKYRCMLILLAEHLAPRSLVDATAEDIEAMLDARQLGARARYHYVSTFHTFYEWAHLHGHVPTDPTLLIDRPRFPRVVPRPISDDDLAFALRHARPEVRAMLALGAFAGLRAKEVANLQREDVLDCNTPPVLIVAEGKGGHQRVVPLNPAVRDAVLAIAEGRSGWLFTTATGRPRAPHAISHAVNDYFERLGIKATFHQCRHYFGTKVYAASRDLRVTQALLGHAHPNTTIGYVAFSTLDAHDAVASLGERP